MTKRRWNFFLPSAHFTRSECKRKKGRPEEAKCDDDRE